MRRFLMGLAVLAGLGGVACAQQAADVAAAVAAPGRATDNVALDPYRKPVEVLTFLGIRPGMASADIFPGFGYYAEIMGRAVGPGGSAVGYEPQQFYDHDARKQKALKAITARQPNTTFRAYPFQRWNAPAASLDFAMLHMFYHELYWESREYNVPRTDPAAFLASLYKAMRPGGIVGVVDHVGPPGDTRAVVNRLHRIDPATVKADFARAGFVFDGESPVLRSAGDDHTRLIFDPAVRLRTDRFVFRFRKPAGSGGNG